MKNKEQILQDFSNDYLEENCVKVYDGTYGEYTYSSYSFDEAWEYAKDKYEEEYE
jgi:hypothetical protein